MSADPVSGQAGGCPPPYREALRPQFHFSSRRGWLNDPNGLVYHQGEYHLFYQHNPGACTWGNIHWGHAVSPDAVHWVELGDALAPDGLGQIFSGSAVVDRENTSGLGKGGKPPLVLIYTGAGERSVQCLASSVDGRVVEKFGGNPVLGELAPGSRDPKVLWHGPSEKWVMCLYVGVPSGGRDGAGNPAVTDTFEFLGSPDLRRWTRMSRVEGFYECPDFFELPLDGDPARRRWVLTDAGSGVRVGGFDGTTFTPETPKRDGHCGRGQDFYAAQTFNDLPGSDGRRIQIGWLKAEAPGMPFNQAMSLPMELGLVSTADGPRLTRNPIAELRRLRRRSHTPGSLVLGPGAPNPFAGVGGRLLEVRAEIDPADSGAVTFAFGGVPVTCDPRGGWISVNGVRAPAPLRDGRQSLALFADVTTIEVFAGGGLTYVPAPVVPDRARPALELGVTGGNARFHLLEAHELGSIWP